MWTEIKAQINILLNKKSAILMYIFMFVLVIINFVSNIITYNGYDLYQMYNSMKISFLSDYVGISFYFVQFLPFLVVIPAGFSYLSDMHSKEIILIQTRSNRKNYYISKAIAVFIVTFIVFTIPLLVEMGLNCIAFPQNAVGDPSNVDIFNLVYNSSIKKYLFADLWISNQYIYVIFNILLLGMYSGILAVFAFAVSICLRFKYKILVFIPVYLLLYILNIIGTLLNVPFKIYYFFYFRMFDVTTKNEIAFILFGIFTAVISMILIFVKIRKDELS